MNKKSAYLIVGLLAIAFLIGGLVWWSSSNSDSNNLETSSSINATKYKGISFDIESGWSEKEQFHIVYPITENVNINNQTEKFLDDKRADFESRIDDSNGVADLNIATEVNFANEEIVLFEFYTTDNTANFKGEVVDSRFYNRETGERYEIDDFFNSDDYLEKLSTLSRLELKELLDDDNQVASGTLPEKENFNNFGIASEDSIFIDFEPGQVASIDKGIVKVEISIEDIADIANEELEEKFIPGFKAEQARVAEVNSSAVDISSVQPQSVEKIDCVNQKCVALTFDDGPHSTNTPILLDILKKYNAKATFFMIGRQVEPNASLVKRVADEGHEIGIHTWDHKDLTSLSAADAKSEIDKTKQAIANAAGIESYLVRPPYGAINDQARAAFGLPTIEWNVDPEDWKDRNANTVYDRVIADTNVGSIVLSHDIHSTTVEAYERIVPKLIDDGFTLVTVSQLLDFSPGNVPVQNYFSQ